MVKNIKTVNNYRLWPYQDSGHHLLYPGPLRSYLYVKFYYFLHRLFLHYFLYLKYSIKILFILISEILGAPPPLRPHPKEGPHPKGGPHPPYPSPGPAWVPRDLCKSRGGSLGSQMGTNGDNFWRVFVVLLETPTLSYSLKYVRIISRWQK